MNASRSVIENGAVAVSRGEIVAVGTSAEIAQKFTTKQTIDARGKLIIPGLINTHTHVPMSLFRGIADDLDLQEWLQKFIFPAEAKNVTEDFVRVGTRLGVAEMIRGGTTTYCDMYYFEDAVADETKSKMLSFSIVEFNINRRRKAIVYLESKKLASNAFGNSSLI